MKIDVALRPEILAMQHQYLHGFVDYMCNSYYHQHVPWRAILSDLWLTKEYYAHDTLARNSRE